MRFRLEPAPPRHVITVLATLRDTDPEQRRRLQLRTDESVGAAIEAIGGSFGLPADAAQRMITPILRQYGRPDRKADLGFGRRTLDAGRYPLFDALGEVGATARLHRGAAVVDIEVEAIAMPAPAADYPVVVGGSVEEGATDDLSSTTTDRGPTA